MTTKKKIYTELVRHAVELSRKLEEVQAQGYKVEDIKFSTCISDSNLTRYSALIIMSK